MKFFKHILFLLFFGIQSAEAIPFYSTQTIKDSLKVVPTVPIVPPTPTPLTVTKIGKEDTDIRKANFLVKSSEATVTFSKGSGIYAFDQYQKAYETSYLLKQEYQTFGENYVPYKHIPVGKTDAVQASITLHKSGIDPESFLPTPKGRFLKAAMMRAAGQCHSVKK